MKLDELVALIEALRQRAQAFASELYQGETLARYALIDPLLRALGWDTGDPSQVRPEYAAGNKKADYVLLDADSSPLILLEAKKLGDKLPSIAGAAVATYAMELANQGKRVKLLATANGLLWELYDFPNMMQPRFSFDLRKGTAAEAAYKALGALWRPLLRPPPVVVPEEEAEREWTPDEFERFWNMLRPGARQVLKEVASRPEGYRSKELQEKLGVKSSSSLAGRLASIGFQMKQFPGLPYPLQSKWPPEGHVYQMSPEVAKAIRKVNH